MQSVNKVSNTDSHKQTALQSSTNVRAGTLTSEFCSQLRVPLLHHLAQPKILHNKCCACPNAINTNRRTVILTSPTSSNRMLL